MAHGLTNSDIARHLVVEVGTVKTHVSRVLMKLGVNDRAQAVAVAYRSRLVGPDDAVPARSV
jgi:DNA-binding NarL/FixJ family response regulator